MDAFWSSIATVSPVLALTLVVQLRDVQKKPRDGDDRASVVSVLVPHVIAVACLVVAVITALGQLLRPTIGRDDAYWVGLLPVSIAICVVLSLRCWTFSWRRAPSRDTSWCGSTVS